MAFEQFSKVAETSATTGTGALSLAGALSGRRAFGAAHADGATLIIATVMGTDWEIARATYASGANTLTRTAILASSNSGSAVNWGAGTKTIREVAPALSELDATGKIGLRALLGATTVGEALFIAASAAAARTAAGAAASGANSDITSLAALLTAPLYAPRGHIAGLTLSNNGSDATNDIDIAAGQARDAADAVLMVLGSGITKRLDASWAVGTGNGGLDTGSIANGTYHIWLIRRSDTGVVDVLFSTSASSPTMPANYDQKRRIGSILRESAAIVAFVQVGDKFVRAVHTADVADAPPAGTTAVTTTLKVPVGVKVEAIVAATFLTSSFSTNGYLLLTDLAQTDSTPSQSANSLAIISAATAVISNSGEFRVMTNTSAQIRRRTNVTTSWQVYLNTVGWIDTRGRFD